MGFEFDIDGIMRDVTEAAAEQVHAVLEEAKRELGDEGREITIAQNTRFDRVGDKVDLAGVSFPSEEIKDKFLAIVDRKLA
jgi:hypothetical protein